MNKLQIKLEELKSFLIDDGYNDSNIVYQTLIDAQKEAINYTRVVESAYLLKVEGQRQVIILAENIADAMDKLEIKGIKDYAFIKSASLNVI